VEIVMKMLPVEQLNPAKYNPRKNLQPGDAEYEKLLRSIEEFGYVEPIIWNERTGNIVGGHQRLKVLQQLGAQELQVVVVDLDPLREKVLNVGLNKISGEFDMEKLSDLLTDVHGQGFDATLTGFDQAEIDQLFQAAGRAPGQVQEDDFDADAAAQAIAEPLTKPGDVWLLGRHRLMCGDSTDQSAVAKLMDGKRARLVFTDPPYNVGYGENDHPSYKKRSILNDKMLPEEFYEFLLKSFRAMASASEPGCMTYVCMSCQEWPNFHRAMQESGYHWSSTIIWVKDHHVMSRKDYHTRFEPIFYGWLASEKRLCPLADRKQNDVWEIPRPQKSDQHPMMKPIALAARAVTNSSRPGDPVLDPFAGSGTTLMACDQTERICFTSELDERYAEAIVQRYIAAHQSDKDVFLLRNGQRLAYHTLT
jgi:DNA modification methylase